MAETKRRSALRCEETGLFNGRGGEDSEGGVSDDGGVELEEVGTLDKGGSRVKVPEIGVDITLRTQLGVLGRS